MVEVDGFYVLSNLRQATSGGCLRALNKILPKSSIGVRRKGAEVEGTILYFVLLLYFDRRKVPVPWLWSAVLTVGFTIVSVIARKLL